MYGLRKNSDYNLPGGSNRRSSNTKRQRNIIVGVLALILVWYFFRVSSDAQIPSKAPTYTDSIKKNDGSRPTPTGQVAIDDETLIEDAIRRNKVVVFAKSYCGFCKSTIETLAPMVDNLYILNLDKHKGKATTF
ncbi:Glutaredoxin, variant 2 [Entomophthora muscae]|uniref:Glutaredoxin, variant 2 n=1 Tax=Entomophthora muscae TaxID=34485 RepID=A0ACC2U3B1_9FUNG|nr:Glutaredoxin, variant 2 [Entomophthora muscae]